MRTKAAVAAAAAAAAASAWLGMHGECGKLLRGWWYARDVYLVPWLMVLVKMICYGNYDHTNSIQIEAKRGNMNDALPEDDTTDTTS